MNAGQLAALIAAVSFAVLAGAAVFVLLRLSRLLSAAAALLSGYRASSQALQDSAAAVVSRADEQLAKTAALGESVDQVTASMTELAVQASAAAATARGISALLAAPLLRLAAFRFGVSHAIALRRRPRGRPGGGPVSAERPLGSGRPDRRRLATPSRRLAVSRSSEQAPR